MHDSAVASESPRSRQQAEHELRAVPLVPREQVRRERRRARPRSSARAPLRPAGRKGRRAARSRVRRSSRRPRRRRRQRRRAPARPRTPSAVEPEHRRAGALRPRESRRSGSVSSDPRPELLQLPRRPGSATATRRRRRARRPAPSRRGPTRARRRAASPASDAVREVGVRAARALGDRRDSPRSRAAAPRRHAAPRRPRARAARSSGRRGRPEPAGDDEEVGGEALASAASRSPGSSPTTVMRAGSMPRRRSDEVRNGPLRSLRSPRTSSEPDATIAARATGGANPSAVTILTAGPACARDLLAAHLDPEVLRVSRSAPTARLPRIARAAGPPAACRPSGPARSAPMRTVSASRRAAPWRGSAAVSPSAP